MSSGPSDDAPGATETPSASGAGGTREPARGWARDPVSGRLVSGGSSPEPAEHAGDARTSVTKTEPPAATAVAESKPSEAPEAEQLRLATERVRQLEAELHAERDVKRESANESRGTGGATSEFLHERLRALESENRATLARLAESERVNEIQRGKLDKLQTTRVTDRVRQLSSRRDGEVARRESQRSSRKSSVTSAQERTERDVEGLIRSKEPSEADRASEKSAERAMKREQKREQKRERERVERKRVAKEVRDAEAQRVREAIARAEAEHAALRTKLEARLAQVESQPLAQIVERREQTSSEGESGESASDKSWGVSEIESHATEGARERGRDRSKRSADFALAASFKKLAEAMRGTKSQQAQSFSDLRGRFFEGPLPKFEVPSSRPLGALDYTWDYQDTLAAELRRTFPADARGLVDGVFEEARACHAEFARAVQSNPNFSSEVRVTRGGKESESARERGRITGRHEPSRRGGRGGPIASFVPKRGRESMTDQTRKQREEWIESQILFEFRKALPAPIVERAKAVCGKDPWASALVFFVLVSIYSDSGSQRNEVEDELLEITQKQGETLSVYATRFERMLKVFREWSIPVPCVERMKVPILAAVEKRVEQLPEAQRFAWWKWYSQVHHESWRGRDYAKLWEVLSVAEDLCMKHPTSQEQSAVRVKTGKGEERASAETEQSQSEGEVEADGQEPQEQGSETPRAG